MGFFIDPQGNYPRHAGDVQLEHDGWEEGVDPLPEGWQDVAEGVVPTIPEGYQLVELTPAEVDGVLTRKFDVVKIDEPTTTA